MTAPQPTRWLASLLVAVVALWGIYQTIGATRSEIPARGLVVGGSFALFLGGWLLLLGIHARRQRRKREQAESLPDSPNQERQRAEASPAGVESIAATEQTEQHASHNSGVR